MKDLIIKTNLMRVSYIREDGNQQLKILVKIGYMSDKKFNLWKQYQVTVRDKFNNIYLISDRDYKRLKESPPTPERLFLFKIEKEIESIIKNFISLGVKFSVSQIHNRLYSIQSKNADEDYVVSWNEFLSKKSYEKEFSSYSKQEIEKIEEAIKEETKRKGILTDEDVDNIKDSVSIEIQIEKEKKYISTLSFDERYAKGIFNNNDIIEVFGFCWSTNLKNNDPYVSYSHKGLIFHLADYIVNGKNVSSFIKNFNSNWVDNFLMFKYKKGYPTVHFRNYTPFDILNQRDSLKNADREMFSVATYRKIVKMLNQYINILQKHGLLSKNIINTSQIKARDYISRNVNRDNYTKIEFTLELEEIEELLNASFDDPQMQLATDMYILQMYCGGLRPNELLKNDIIFTNNSVSFFRHKNKKIAKNPMLPEVSAILKKYPNRLPAFLDIETYRRKLKEIAKHFNWDRLITEPNTKIGANQQIIVHKLYDVFYPYTARKTFINYLANMGLPEEQIIQFTDHSDVKILKHYKQKLNLEQKRKLIENLLKNV